MYRRTAIAYVHMKLVLDYIAEGHDLDETILRFYRLNKNRSKKKQINKWLKCELRDATVLSNLQSCLSCCGSTHEDMFAASGTWVKLFLRRHKMALRTRTRLGQTTPADAQEAAVQFREIVLRTIIEKQCTRLYNADQTVSS
ncbi:hypothetical protein PC116_g27083 [Phytophthora cactorum]|nr:hypothetical protein PC116_g27083 [Phytophthora cactorum]